MGSASDFLLAPATTRSWQAQVSTRLWSGTSSSRPSTPPSPTRRRSSVATLARTFPSSARATRSSSSPMSHARSSRRLGDVKAVFTTAGTLGPVGIRGWLLGELPNPIKVKGDESEIRKYVLGCAGHDGYTAVVIKNVATRVVCANTLGRGARRTRWREPGASNTPPARRNGSRRLARRSGASPSPTRPSASSRTCSL